MKNAAIILVSSVFLFSTSAFGDAPDVLANEKGFACVPRYSELVKTLTPLFQEISAHITNELRKRKIEVAQITPDTQNSSLLAYPGGAFDYVALIPTEIVTKQGRKLSIISYIEDTDYQRIKVSRLAIPLWTSESGANSNCPFIKGENVEMGSGDLSKIAIVDSASKKTLVSGLFGAYTARIDKQNESSNPPPERRPDRGPGTCIQVPPGMTCPACCPN